LLLVVSTCRGQWCQFALRPLDISRNTRIARRERVRSRKFGGTQEYCHNPTLDHRQWRCETQGGGVGL